MKNIPCDRESILYLIWLQEILKDVTMERKKELVCRFGSAKALYHADYESVKEDVSSQGYLEYFSKEALGKAKKIERSNEIAGIQYIIPEKFPGENCKFFIIYYLGTLQEGPFACVVGSRIYTVYGTHYSKVIVKDLTGQGACINSGLAIGIDTKVHKFALDEGCKVQAFMSGGLDNCYPYENKWMFDEIAKKGAVISPYPIGKPPRRYRFLQRNALMCSMSHKVIVVEAHGQSGALYTADTAHKMGKDVYSVNPFSDSPYCRGNNILLEKYAKEYRINSSPSSEDISYKSHVLELIKNGTRSTDGIINESDLPETKVHEDLLDLTCRKLVVFRGDGLWHYKGW